MSNLIVKTIIPKFRLHFDKDQIEHYHSLVDNILTKDRPISNGDLTEEFEERFAKEIGSKYAIAVGSGTDALELSCRMIEGSKKKVVLIPTNSMISDALSVERSGFQFSLYDMDTFNLGAMAQEVRRYIETLEIFSGAVIGVHIGGIVANNIDYLIEITKENGLLFIEDACQAHFSKYKDQYAGTLGDLSCFSFSATKVMTTGEGGMILTNVEEYANKIKCIREFGSTTKDKHLHEMIGGNFKMTELQSALGLTELERVHKRIERRSEITKRYIEGLDQKKYKVIEPFYLSSNYKTIVMISGLRKDLYNHMEKHGISMTGEVYPIPLHDQPVFRGRFSKLAFPNADQFCKNHVCPPNYPELTDEEVDLIIQTMNSWKPNHALRKLKGSYY